jgi:hypothetical protein
VVTTALSYLAKFEEKFDMIVVGEVPTGFVFTLHTILLHVTSVGFTL